MTWYQAQATCAPHWHLRQLGGGSLHTRPAGVCCEVSATGGHVTFWEVPGTHLD